MVVRVGGEDPRVWLPRTGDLGRPFVKMLAEARLLAEVFQRYVAICGKTVGGIT
jgi:hypothetical protein